MKIILAKSAGFCFGVKRALNIANKTAKDAKNVCMLGDIVHNEDVVRQINKVGVKKIKALGKGKGKTLLIRAHGASRQTFGKASKLGYNIIDATCPMVKEIHKIAKENERKGYHLIIIGDKKHEEVQGIIGQLKNKTTIIDSIKNIPVNKLKKFKKAAVVVQSTQNLEKTLKIIAVLKTHVKNFVSFNTICNPTRKKQAEIKTLPLKNDIVIIVGSKTSANTKRLYEISKSLNKHTYWIKSKNDIKLKWFTKAKRVGITTGASTPDNTTKKIVEYIMRLSSFI